MEEDKKTYPEALCQFCQEPVKHPDKLWVLYLCNNCGAEYSLEVSEDIAEVVLEAEEEGKEVRVLKHYDFSKKSKDEPGVWMHLVFFKKKECNGAY